MASKTIMDIVENCKGWKIYEIGQPYFNGVPNHPNNVPSFFYALHRRMEFGTGQVRVPAAGMMVTTEHSGTHIDALCHQSENMMLHGGVKVDAKVQTSAGFTILGAETIGPIIGRGVLLDIAAYDGVPKLAPKGTISLDKLKKVAEKQQTPIRKGDIVLVRTGYGSLWEDPEKYWDAPGVAVEGSQWLADIGVRAVGADNTTWEYPDTSHIDPIYKASLPAHVIFLVRAGIYIMEHLNLEAFSKEKKYEFLFVCLPLKLKGATASPVTPVAIVI